MKPFLLGIHYGLTVIGAAARLKVSLEEAARYLEMHQTTVPQPIGNGRLIMSTSLASGV